MRDEKPSKKKGRAKTEPDKKELDKKNNSVTARNFPEKEITNDKAKSIETLSKTLLKKEDRTDGPEYGHRARGVWCL